MSSAHRERNKQITVEGDFLILHRRACKHVDTENRNRQTNTQPVQKRHTSPLSQLCLSQNYFFLTGAPFFFPSPRVLTTTCWNQNVDVSTPAPSSGVISFPSHEGRSTSGSLFGYSQTLRTGGNSLATRLPACLED